MRHMPRVPRGGGWRYSVSETQALCSLNLSELPPRPLSTASWGKTEKCRGQRTLRQQRPPPHHHPTPHTHTSLSPCLSNQVLAEESQAEKRPQVWSQDLVKGEEGPFGRKEEKSSLRSLHAPSALHQARGQEFSLFYR